MVWTRLHFYAITGQIQPANQLFKTLYHPLPVANKRDMLRHSFDHDHLTIGELLKEGSPKGGQTPLHLASLMGHTEFVKVLVFYGADVNARDDNGCTPLWHAAFEGNLETVKCLIHLGAISELRGKFCYHARAPMTPRQMAERNGHYAIAEYLQKIEEDIQSEAIQKENQINNETKSTDSVEQCNGSECLSAEQQETVADVLIDSAVSKNQSKQSEHGEVEAFRPRLQPSSM